MIGFLYCTTVSYTTSKSENSSDFRHRETFPLQPSIYDPQHRLAITVFGLEELCVHMIISGSQQQAIKCRRSLLGGLAAYIDMEALP